MAKSVGLRTEIIFHITLLLGAALLFGGFLMLKLTERELLNQRLDHLNSTMEVVGRSISEVLAFEEKGQVHSARVKRLLDLIPEASALGAWKLEGDSFVPLYLRSQEDSLMNPPPQNLRFLAEPKEKLVYAGAWMAWGGLPDSYFQTTLPVRQRGKLVGLLQARFPLDDVALRVRSSLKMLLVYVLLYGTVLFLFGLYLLNRNVVRPIGSLMATTRLLASGDLDQRVDEQGPREIASLARTYNEMVSALRESRRRTEDHIRSLQETNEELQQTRDELVRSERMASVGHLAAGMAHEIGNPLAAVVGYLELLKTALPEGRQRDITEYAAEEVGRIDRLVRDLLDYAKPGKEQAESFDPQVVFREALDLLGHQGKFAGVKLIDDLPQQLPKVVMIRHRLLQVLVNLLVNARDAVAEGGEIRLTAGENAETVWLTVADNGTGIAARDLPHIFDPFYTTKALGKGRGLGLAVCYRVLEEAGGVIEVQSEAGRGSVFTVRLKKEDGSHEG